MKIDAISSVTNWDYFFLKSSFMSETMKRVNCYECKLNKNHDKIKKMQGCEEIKEIPIFPTDEFTYYTCAGKFKLQNWSGINKLCELFEKGINPYGGSVIEVPNKLVEVSNIIHNFRAEQKLKEAKEWQTKSR